MAELYSEDDACMININENGHVIVGFGYGSLSFHADPSDLIHFANEIVGVVKDNG